MTWTEALKVATLVVGALGGGGVIVFGLSGFLGKLWIDRLKGDIDARLARLDAALEHGTFLQRRMAELELEAITECWRSARVCLPLLYATRADDSGENEEVLAVRREELAQAHNAFLANYGRHEPFLPDAIADTLEKAMIVIRRELSQIDRQPHFNIHWCDAGARNHDELKALTSTLLVQVKTRTAQLRAAVAEARW